MHLNYKYQVTTSKRLLIYGHLYVPLVIMGKFDFGPLNPETTQQPKFWYAL